MRKPVLVHAAFAAAFVVVSVDVAYAQTYESVGIRAQGMGGAFVAIADDASATWWNPAGLAGGAYVNTIVEYGTSQDPKVATDANGAVPSWRTDVRAFSAAYPALGLSYYRLRVSQIQPITATAGSTVSRQDPGQTPVQASSLLLQEFGATVGQSFGNHLVLGSTLKLLHGGLATSADVASTASLGAAGSLEPETENHVDLDLGAMARFGMLSIGAAMKNVSEPTFGSGASAIQLRRQTRVGVGLESRRARGTLSTASVAFDADLTTTVMATGDVRHVAGGFEGWLFKKSFGVRAGVSANTIGAARPSAGAGLSLALRSSTYVDAQVTQGDDQSRNGWGVALRVTF